MTVTNGWTLTPGTPPSFDPTSAPTVFNPFGTGGPTPTFGTLATTTVRTIIDTARVQHFAFADLHMPDGAALLHVNQRQRELMGLLGDGIEGLVGTGLQYPVLRPSSAVLVSFANGVPYIGVSGQDGWAMHVDENDVPYVDPTEPMLASDPVGDTPGFPLPSEMVRLVSVMLLFGQDRWVPCDVVGQRSRQTAMPGRNPVVFVAGNRLMPMRAYDDPARNSADRWPSITGIQLSYVALTTVTGLDDPITLPSVLVGALIADTAALFAMQAKDCQPSERVQFRQEADRHRAEVREMAMGLLDGASHSAVHYKG